MPRPEDTISRVTDLTNQTAQQAAASLMEDVRSVRNDSQQNYAQYIAQVTEGLVRSGKLPELAIGFVQNNFAALDAKDGRVDGRITRQGLTDYLDEMDGTHDGNISDPLARAFADCLLSRFDRLVTLSTDRDGQNIITDLTANDIAFRLNQLREPGPDVNPAIVAVMRSPVLFGYFDAAHTNSQDGNIGWHDLNHIVMNWDKFARLGFPFTKHDVEVWRDNFDTPEYRAFRADGGNGYVTAASIHGVAEQRFENQVVARYNAGDLRLTEIVLPNGRGTWINNGNFWSFKDSQGNFYTGTIDCVGDPIINPDGSIRFTHADGCTTTFRYDAEGKLTQVDYSRTLQNSQAVTMRLTFDQNGNPLVLTLPDGTTVEKNADNEWIHYGTGRIPLGKVMGPPMVTPDGTLGFAYPMGISNVPGDWKIMSQDGHWHIFTDRGREFHQPGQPGWAIIRNDLTLREVHYNNGAVVRFNENEAITEIGLPDGSLIKRVPEGAPPEQQRWVVQRDGTSTDLAPGNYNLQLTPDGTLIVSDSSGRVTEIRYKAGQQGSYSRRFVYDASGNISAVIEGTRGRIDRYLGSSTAWVADAEPPGQGTNVVYNLNPTVNLNGEYEFNTPDGQRWVVHNNGTAEVIRLADGTAVDPAATANDAAQESVSAFAALFRDIPPPQDGFAARAQNDALVRGLLAHDGALFAQIDVASYGPPPDGKISQGDVQAFIDKCLRGDRAALQALQNSGLTIRDLYDLKNQWNTGRFALMMENGFLTPLGVFRGSNVRLDSVDSTASTALSDSGLQSTRIEKVYNVPISEFSDPEERFTTTCNIDGKPLSVTYPGGGRADFHYDANGELNRITITRANGTTETFNKTESGWTDTRGNRISSPYVDEFGRIEYSMDGRQTVIRPNGTVQEQILYPPNSDRQTLMLKDTLPDGSYYIHSGATLKEVYTHGARIIYDNQGWIQSVALPDGTIIRKNADNVWARFTSGGAEMGTVGTPDIRLDPPTSIVLTINDQPFRQSNGAWRITYGDGIADSFNADNRLVSRTYGRSGIRVDYDPALQIPSISFPGGATWTFNAQDGKWYINGDRTNATVQINNGDITIIEPERTRVFKANGESVETNGAGISTTRDINGNVVRIATADGRLWWLDGTAWKFKESPTSAEVNLPAGSEPPVVTADSITFTTAQGTTVYRYDATTDQLREIAEGSTVRRFANGQLIETAVTKAIGITVTTNTAGDVIRVETRDGRAWWLEGTTWMYRSSESAQPVRLPAGTRAPVLEGSTITVSDGNQSSIFRYDGAGGRLQFRIEPNGISTPNWSWEFNQQTGQWTIEGQVYERSAVEFINGGRDGFRLYKKDGSIVVYDGQGRATEVQYSTTPPTRRTFAYDDQGNIRSFVEPNGWAYERQPDGRWLVYTSASALTESDPAKKQQMLVGYPTDRNNNPLPPDRVDSSQIPSPIALTLSLHFGHFTMRTTSGGFTFYSNGTNAILDTAGRVVHYASDMGIDVARERGFITVTPTDGSAYLISGLHDHIYPNGVRVHTETDTTTSPPTITTRYTVGGASLTVVESGSNRSIYHRDNDGNLLADSGLISRVSVDTQGNLITEYNDGTVLKIMSRPTLNSGTALVPEPLPGGVELTFRGRPTISAASATFDGTSWHIGYLLGSFSVRGTYDSTGQLREITLPGNPTRTVPVANLTAPPEFTPDGVRITTAEGVFVYRPDSTVVQTRPDGIVINSRFTASGQQTIEKIIYPPVAPSTRGAQIERTENGWQYTGADGQTIILDRNGALSIDRSGNVTFTHENRTGSGNDARITSTTTHTFDRTGREVAAQFTQFIGDRRLTVSYLAQDIENNYTLPNNTRLVNPRVYQLPDGTKLVSQDGSTWYRFNGTTFMAQIRGIPVITEAGRFGISADGRTPPPPFFDESGNWRVESVTDSDDDSLEVSVNPPPVRPAPTRLELPPDCVEADRALSYLSSFKPWEHPPFADAEGNITLNSLNAWLEHAQGADANVVAAARFLKNNFAALASDGHLDARDVLSFRNQIFDNYIRTTRFDITLSPTVQQQLIDFNQRSTLLLVERGDTPVILGRKSLESRGIANPSPQDCMREFERIMRLNGLNPDTDRFSIFVGQRFNLYSQEQITQIETFIKYRGDSLQGRPMSEIIAQALATPIDVMTSPPAAPTLEAPQNALSRFQSLRDDLLVFGQYAPWQLRQLGLIDGQGHVDWAAVERFAAASTGDTAHAALRAACRRLYDARQDLMKNAEGQPVLAVTMDDVRRNINDGFARAIAASYAGQDAVAQKEIWLAEEGVLTITINNEHSTPWDLAVAHLVKMGRSPITNRDVWNEIRHIYLANRLDANETEEEFWGRVGHYGYVLRLYTSEEERTIRNAGTYAAAQQLTSSYDASTAYETHRPSGAHG
ncbi:MAG TPA: hypothetical protein V6D17_18400 [Candidatus Obscuribacterales bacterium]